MRYGANMKARPDSRAASRRRVSSHASAYAARPHNGNDSTKATLYAATGLCVSHCTANVIGSSPMRSSDSAMTFAAGKSIGAFHQAAVSGRRFELHQRSQIGRASLGKERRSRWQEKQRQQQK